jgi:hypothetical protein
MSKYRDHQFLACFECYNSEVIEIDIGSGQRKQTRVLVCANCFRSGRITRVTCRTFKKID